MTRRFLDDVRTDIDSQMVVNITGDITPDILRPLFNDMLDSSVDDELGITLAAAEPALALTTDWVKIPITVVSGGDAAFLIADGVNNQATTTATAGFTYAASGHITCIATNNDVIELAIGVNGVPSGFVGALTGRGGSRAYSTNAESLELSSTASAVYTLMARAQTTTTLNLTFAALVLTIKPTNNP